MEQLPGVMDVYWYHKLCHLAPFPTLIAEWNSIYGVARCMHHELYHGQTLDVKNLVCVLNPSLCFSSGNYTPSESNPSGQYGHASMQCRLSQLTLSTSQKAEHLTASACIKIEWYLYSKQLLTWSYVPCTDVCGFHAFSFFTFSLSVWYWVFLPYYNVLIKSLF